MEKELEEFDKFDLWNKIFSEIRNVSSEYGFTCSQSRKIENMRLNRYADVIPFDHNRVRLGRGDRDYINASLIDVESADRNYILTQGPLPNTIGHFWLMIWEQKSTAIIMLNKVIERGRVKCAQYWPSGSDNDGQDEFVFENLDIKVEFLSEEKSTHYITRYFRLTDLSSGESRTVTQFNYISWPDFGLPKSPSSLLEFLYAIRQSGALNKKMSGPPVIHCSAGIGRSGTLCLVDSCLVLIENLGDIEKVDIRKILLEMRKYRMGLVQTPEQLRFSYLTIIEGARKYVNSNKHVPTSQEIESTEELSQVKETSAIRGDEITETKEEQENNTSNEDGDDDDKPELPQKERSQPSSANQQLPENGTSSSTQQSKESTAEASTLNNSDTREMRLQARKEKNRRTNEKLKEIKEKLKKSEESDSDGSYNESKRCRFRRKKRRGSY